MGSSLYAYVITENRLLWALEHEEFALYIQPVVRSSDLKVFGGKLSPEKLSCLPVLLSRQYLLVC